MHSSAVALPRVATKSRGRTLGRVRNAVFFYLAVAILSEKYGSYMTGASVVVDGGIALYNWLDASG